MTGFEPSGGGAHPCMLTYQLAGAMPANAARNMLDTHAGVALWSCST